MMRNLTIMAVGALALAACGSPESPAAMEKRRSAEAEENAAAKVGPMMADLGAAGRHVCVGISETRIKLGSELKGGYRSAFITDAADEAGVRVYTSYTDVTSYGSVVINYATKTESCLLWSESLTLQEYAVRLGMSPVGLTKHFDLVAGN